MAEHAELRLPADEQYVWLARMVVTVAARQAGMAPGRVEDLKIAVSEATTNAINAHKRMRRAEPVVLTFGSTGDGFAVTITDAGSAFDPVMAAESANNEWQPERGLGLTLIRGLADEVAFSRDAGMRMQLRFTVLMEDVPGNGEAPGG